MRGVHTASLARSVAVPRHSTTVLKGNLLLSIACWVVPLVRSVSLHGNVIEEWLSVSNGSPAYRTVQQRAPCLTNTLLK